MTPEQQAAIREAVARGLCSTHARHSPDHARSDEDMLKFIDWHWSAHGDQADAAIAAHLKALEAAGIVPSEDRIDELEEALHRIVQWADAYPLDIFPEPDFARAAHLLSEGGITLDSISASILRRAVAGVGKIAREALAARPR